MEIVVVERAERSNDDARSDAAALDGVAETSSGDAGDARAVQVGETGAMIGASGGVIEAGDARLEIPENAIRQAVEITLRTLPSLAALDRRPPPSEAIGVYSATPWNPNLARASTLTVALSRSVEPGERVELLAWQPSMRAFIVASFGTVDESGQRVSFSVRQLGDMVVRVAPKRALTADERCPGAPMAIHESWPGGSEEAVVGLTEIEDRLPRARAFSVLTDLRLARGASQIDFKNEEVTDSLATRGDERDHRDEDYLMDPNAAAAVLLLSELVRQEWVDPLSGRPAVELRITEAYDSFLEHQTRSSHYQGRAVDLTLSPSPAANRAERTEWFGRLARLAVCSGFDYVLFEDPFHVHASVVATEIALLVRDDDGELRIATSEIRDPRALRSRRERAVSDAGTDGRFEWPARGRFSVTDPGSDRDSAAAPDTTVDGLRQLRVVDGVAYLVNADDGAPLGSVNADGASVDVEHPFVVSHVDMNVVGAAFLRHGRLPEAWAEYAPRETE